jgi:hypothetical protein
MIRLINSLSARVRFFLVVAFAAMTMWAGASSAQAEVISAIHIAQGERMLPDGGWSSACDTRIEQCIPSGNEGSHGLAILHHHHHADCQFSGLIGTADNVIGRAGFAQARFPAYAAVDKPAPASTADQPPKA